MVSNVLNKFFPNRTKIDNQDVQEVQRISLTPVTRQKNMEEEARKAYATELYDTYFGFGAYYVGLLIKASISNMNIQREMLKVTKCLPLLEYFTNSISRVYSTQPVRKFYLEGKEIIKTPANNDADEVMDADKFIYNDELYENLINLYNDQVNIAIKQSEKFTNLFNTTIYKVVTNELGQMRLVFIPNDTVEIKESNYDLNSAEQIAFIQDVSNSLENKSRLIPIIEIWTKDFKEVPINKVDREVLGVDEDKINQASEEYFKLFDTKEAGSAFAPFVVLRDSAESQDFWDLKNKDVVSYIKSINLSLTELKYLESSTSFGLKYTVNIKPPEDGVLDPRGIINFAVANNVVPGMDDSKNFEIGEFDNKGRIDEVIRSIIFNMKMLFTTFNIPLDALISTNSVRSAENKELDNEELFSSINEQRDIWNTNEQNLFKVMQAVHNRDNQYKIPRDIELVVNYVENETSEKTSEDWMIEIQNDVSTVLDWMAEIHPDLDRDELMGLLTSNREINAKQKQQSLDLESFMQSDQEDSDNINQNNQNNDADNNSRNN